MWVTESKYDNLPSIIHLKYHKYNPRVSWKEPIALHILKSTAFKTCTSTKYYCVRVLYNKVKIKKLYSLHC